MHPMRFFRLAAVMLVAYVSLRATLAAANEAVISDNTDGLPVTSGEAAITAALASQRHGVLAQAELTAAMGSAIPALSASLERTRRGVDELCLALDGLPKNLFGGPVSKVLTALLDGFDAERSCLLPPCGLPFDPPAHDESRQQPDAAIATDSCDAEQGAGCSPSAGSSLSASDGNVQPNPRGTTSPRLVNQGDLEEALRHFLMAMRMRVEQTLPRTMRVSTRSTAAGVTADATTQAARALLMLGRAAGSPAVSSRLPMILEAIESATALQQDVFAATSASVRMAVTLWRMGSNSSEAPLAAVPCSSQQYGPNHATSDLVSAFSLLNRFFVAAGSPHSFEPPTGRPPQGTAAPPRAASSTVRGPAEKRALEFNMQFGTATALGQLHEELLNPAKSPFAPLLSVLGSASVACTNVPSGPPRGWKPPPLGELDPVLHAPYANVEGGCSFEFNKGVVRFLGPSMDGAEQCRVAAWRDAVAALHETIRGEVVPCVLKLMVVQALAAG